MDSSLLYIKDTNSYAFILYHLGLGRIPYMCICLTTENCWWGYEKGGGGQIFQKLFVRQFDRKPFQYELFMLF